jgi:hypothetical protein
MTVIVRHPPAPDDGVEHLRRIVNPPVDATTKLRAAYFLALSRD